jgi:hypothetical protein
MKTQVFYRDGVRFTWTERDERAQRMHEVYGPAAIRTTRRWVKCEKCSGPTTTEVRVFDRWAAWCGCGLKIAKRKR